MKSLLTRLSVLSIVLLLLSCNRNHFLAVAQEESQSIQLGMIAEFEGFLVKQVELKSRPINQQPIGISITKKPFTKKAFKKYQKLNDPTVYIAFHDSLEVKPKYLELEIIDDVAYAQSLNDDAGLYDFLKNSKRAKIVSRLSLALDDIGSIGNSGDFYLSKISAKEYEITTKVEGKRKVLTQFSESKIFDYGFSIPCWGKDSRGNTQILDIVEEGKTCRRPLKKKANKPFKTKNLYDY